METEGRRGESGLLRGTEGDRGAQRGTQRGTEGLGGGQKGRLIARGEHRDHSNRDRGEHRDRGEERCTEVEV